MGNKLDFKEIIDTLNELYETDSYNNQLFFTYTYCNGIDGITLQQDILLYDTESDGPQEEFTNSDILSICIDRLLDLSNTLGYDPRKVKDT